MARKYNASSIAVLDEMEGVRANVGMYLGDVDESGTLQCFNEILQNASDEATECGGGRLRVIVKGQRVTVADQGRGIPVELHPKTKVSTLVTVLTRLHAGGKTTGKSAYGDQTIGVHGVGASVVNACSERMTVSSFRDGAWHSVSFSKGKPLGGVTKGRCPLGRWPRGTVVEYELDRTVLPAPLDLKAVRRLCDIARHFSPITIELSLDGKSEVLEPRQPQDMLKRILRKDHDEVVLGPVSINAGGVRLVAAWTRSPDCRLSPHVAGSLVPNGTHVIGLTTAVQEALVAALPREGKSVEDATVGMVAVLNVNVPQPAFSGQSKSTLRTRSARRQVVEAVLPTLTKFFKANKASVAEMAEHARNVLAMDREHRERRRMARDAGVSTKGKLNLPKNLVAALGFPPARRELYIVEGKSAKGTGEDAKEPWQEILDIRGKLPNLFKRRRDAMINETISSVVSSIGYDPRNPDRPLRVGRVILLADADDDGDHITCLLLGMFYKIMPELLRKGMVYIVDAPLFEAMTSDGRMVSGDSLRELEKKHGRLTHVNRMKGWGGCDVPLLREVAFNPETRRIRRVAPPTTADAKEFERLLGVDSMARKELLGTSVSETHDDKGKYDDKRGEKHHRRGGHGTRGGTGSREGQGGRAAPRAAGSDGRRGAEGCQGPKAARGRADRRTARGAGRRAGRPDPREGSRA